MRKKIDLLPPFAQKIKTRRKEIIFFASAQIIIFFALGIFIFLVNELNDFDSRDVSRFEIIAEELRAARESARIDEIISRNLPAAFEREQLNFILETVPENAELSRIEYARGEILILGVADDLNTVEIHRQNVAEIFAYVRSGRINRADGRYLYEIFAAE